MRFGVYAGSLALLAFVCSAPAGATDIPIPGKITIIKDGLFKLVAKPTGAFTLPGAADPGSPLLDNGEVNAFDMYGPGAFTDPLTAGTWTGLGNPAGSKGYKYSNPAAPSGGPVKVIIMKPAGIKILAKDDQSLSDAAPGGALGIELVTGTGPDKRCAYFGGTVVAHFPGLIKRKHAPAPGACPVDFQCAGCNDDSYIGFLTPIWSNSPGDCGDIIDDGGSVVSNVACAGLYTGGGGNSVPLPYPVPDFTQLVTKITTCTGAVTTLGPTVSTETGSIRNCSSPGCFFGAPLAVPNPGSTPTSVCVLNTYAAPASGTADCSTGATNLSVPLGSILYLTGDTANDPGSTIPGIQPCPLCTDLDELAVGTCIGGANNGMACIPGSTSLEGNPSYPTSIDCPPDPMFDIGTLPIAFNLSSGVVTWTGTTATNDTGSTASVQNRVFAGYCRDADGTLAFANPAEPCWENGIAVGPACAGTYESCEQRNNGAFGPNGGLNRTITAIGNTATIPPGGAGVFATLVSIFSVPPTFNATVDAAGDLPGPGVTALPGILGSQPNP